MEKKAFFYKMIYKQNGKKKNVSSRDFFEDVIAKHGVKTGTASDKIISVQITHDERPITLDILDYKSKYLFARIGKIKPNSDMQFREYDTLQTSDVLSFAELNVKGVEIFTYFILEYSSNIVGFVYGKSAPHISSLENLSNLSKWGYELEIQPIAHTDTVANLSRKGSALKSISYEISTPSDRLLGGAGLDKETIADINEENGIMMSVVVKADPYYNLIEDHNVIRKVLTKLRANKEIKKLKVRAKEPFRKMRDYNLLDDYLFYNVNIEETYTEAGIQKRYTTSEYRKLIEDKLRKELDKNKEVIYTLAGIRED